MRMVRISPSVVTLAKKSSSSSVSEEDAEKACKELELFAGPDVGRKGGKSLILSIVSDRCLNEW
jgi:hypothetical protein